MEKRIMLTPLKLRILQLIAERGEIPTASEIAKELNESIGSISNSLKSLRTNRKVTREFAQVLLNVDEAGVFEKPKSDPWEVGNKTRRMKAEQGYYVANKPPYGCKVENGVVSFISEAVPKIQQAFRLRAEGVAFSEIEEKTGILEHTLRVMLVNPVYVGKVRYKKVVYPGKHKDRAIINEELFGRTQVSKKGLFVNPGPFMRRVQGRFLWKDEKAEEIVNEIFRMRKEEKTFKEIGEKFGFNESKIRYIIRNPKYAGKKRVNGELVDEPHIDAKIDFDLWQAANDVNLEGNYYESMRKQGDENANKVWKALPGTVRELGNKTGLSKHQIQFALKRLKPRILRLQDARWYQKDEVTLTLHRMLNQKGWKTLTPIYPKGIETRDKILSILLGHPATEREINKKVGYCAVQRLERFKVDGLVEKRSDDKYYINAENAKFLRTVQGMLEVIRRQYS